MHIPSLIEKKRDGGELAAAEIEELIADFTDGDIPDYQMSAWAMAVFFRGMTAAETQHLTDAMTRSGRSVASIRCQSSSNEPALRESSP